MSDFRANSTMQTTKTSRLSEWRYRRKMFPVNGYFQTGAVSWLRDQVRASKHVSESNDRQIRTSWCSRLVQPPSPVRPTGPTRSAILENQRTRHLLLLCLLRTRTHAHTHTDWPCYTSSTQLFVAVWATRRFAHPAPFHSHYSLFACRVPSLSFASISPWT